MAITQVITTPPAAPTPGEDAAVFNTKILARLSWDTTNVSELNTFAAQANALETAVNDDAASAASSATTAVNAPGTSATSSTSVTIGTGSKSLTIQTGKSIVVGMWVVIASTSGPATNYMIGAVTSYNSSTGALVVNVTAVGGSGTIAAWTVSLTPPPSGQFLSLTGGAISANSASAALRITQIGSGNALEVEDSSNPDSTPFVIDSSGNIAIGTTVSGGGSGHLRISQNVTGSPSSVSLLNTSTLLSDVTSAFNVFQSQPSTIPAVFSLTRLTHFLASTVTLGAGSSITDLFCFRASGSSTIATNNYGFFGEIAAGTGKWNFYATGSARNYFAGGVEPLAGSVGQESGFINISAAAGAPSGAPTNPIGNVPLYYDTANNKLYVYNGSWKATAALT